MLLINNWSFVSEGRTRRVSFDWFNLDRSRNVKRLVVVPMVAWKIAYRGVGLPDFPPD